MAKKPKNSTKHLYFDTRGKFWGQFADNFQNSFIPTKNKILLYNGTKEYSLCYVSSFAMSRQFCGQFSNNCQGNF